MCELAPGNEDIIMRHHLAGCAFALALAAGVVIAGLGPVKAQPAREDRVAIDYVAPVNAAHQPLFEFLKQNQALERVRGVLVAISWPRTLRLEVRGCEGEPNAWYENASITLCYEFLDDLWRRANAPARPAGITREDAFIGPFLEVSLHEAGHALFDLLKVPILGREEDAADQLASYYMLQLPRETRSRLVLGSAYAYASELNVRSARDLYKPRLQLGPHVAFADEHGTPAQRLYNLLCIAYGSDKQLFAEVVEKRYLPEERAELCEGEYRQVEFAYRTLIAPHLDGAR